MQVASQISEEIRGRITLPSRTQPVRWENAVKAEHGVLLSGTYTHTKSSYAQTRHNRIKVIIVD